MPLADDDVGFGLAHHCADDDVIRELAGDTPQKYGAVIFNFRPIVLSHAVYRSDVCCLPVQSCGTTRVLRDDRSSRVRAGVISTASSFRIRGEIPSGLGALVGSRPSSSKLLDSCLSDGHGAALGAIHVGVLRFVRASSSAAEQEIF